MTEPEQEASDETWKQWAAIVAVFAIIAFCCAVLSWSGAMDDDDTDMKCDYMAETLGADRADLDRNDPTCREAGR